VEKETSSRKYIKGAKGKKNIPGRIGNGSRSATAMKSHERKKWDNHVGGHKCHETVSLFLENGWIEIGGKRGLVKK